MKTTRKSVSKLHLRWLSSTMPSTASCIALKTSKTPRERWITLWFSLRLSITWNSRKTI